ncbi:MAG: hypothetical protein M3290_02400 [Actinomycetota bacterium]|nr:hypothetical protein [Actinomycetota bacterium]
MTTDPRSELAELLDEVAFELTQARAATLDNADGMRAALKRAHDLIGQADALVSSVAAARRSDS